jgi:hypothetical protein
MITRPQSFAAPLAMAALLAAASGLSACGKTGALEQPAPLFGVKAKADYEAQKRKEAEEKAAQDRARRENNVPSPDDATAQPLTQAPYAAPLPGHDSPFGNPPPQGSMPNPGTADDR